MLYDTQITIFFMFFLAGKHNVGPQIVWIPIRSHDLQGGDFSGYAEPYCKVSATKYVSFFSAHE